MGDDSSPSKRRRNSAVRLLMVGPPGCGKGTQAALLSEKLGIPAISTGDMLRQAVAAGSELGQKVKGIMSEGALVDDETMAQVVEDRLAAADAQDGFILDGYPRNLDQAETLAGILDGAQESLDAVLVLDVPQEELVRRALARKRADDKEEVIRERLRVYEEKTEPLIHYYRERGILRRVDGHLPVEQVTSRLLEALSELHKP